MATPLPNLYNLFENLRSHVECLKEGIEPQFIQMALNFEQCRCRWLKVEAELGMSKEVLAKAEAERGALEVKLKHARNQVDVEIRRRQKAEADYEKLDRQILLIRDLLVTDSSSCSIQLNEEQRNALAFLSVRTQPAASNHNISHRLSTIDESTSILSDISYDKTEDSLDWDSSVVRTVRLRKRQKRRSSRTHVDGPPDAGKRVRSTGRVSDRGNESIVARTTLTVPANGGPIEAVSTIEAMPHLSRNKRRTAPKVWSTDTDTDTLSEYASEAPSEPVTVPFTPKSTRGAKQHVLTSKTVIRPETCLPCGKRIKFGKLSLRCRDCRLVAHVECRDHCTLPCCPTQGNTSTRTKEDSLVDYISDCSPMVPLLVVHCIREIERRGLHETGLYRVSGADRTVRELKEKFLRGKNIPSLSQVDDIHAVTGLLKYFLRNLRQPLLTFRLNRAFMQAAEIPDDDNSVAAIYQTISDLPPPNRDTLAFLVLHLQRVSQNADTKMDVFNLARVFGPTIVGHAVPEPDHMTMLQDTQRQPKVVERLLGLPAGYWQQFVPDQDDLQQTTAPDRNCFDTPNHKVSILGPVTTPEHQLSKTPSSSSLTQRVMSSLSKNTPIFGGSKSKAGVCVSRPNNFFSSPMLK